MSPKGTLPLDGVFWTEQSCTTGKRALFFESSDGEREQWAVGHSVQSYGLLYSSGKWRQIQYTSMVAGHSSRPPRVESSSPPKMVSMNRRLPPPNLFFLFLPMETHLGMVKIHKKAKITRFADFSMGVIHIFAVHESHLKSSSDPDNVLVSIDRKTKKYTVIVSASSCLRKKKRESRPKEPISMPIHECLPMESTWSGWSGTTSTW